MVKSAISALQEYADPRSFMRVMSKRPNGGVTAQKASIEGLISLETFGKDTGAPSRARRRLLHARISMQTSRARVRAV